MFAATATPAGTSTPPSHSVASTRSRPFKLPLTQSRPQARPSLEAHCPGAPRCRKASVIAEVARGTLPGIVPIEHVLAQTERVAVCVTRLAAYPTGFELDLLAMITPDEDDFDPILFHRHALLRSRRVDELPPEILRFGVQFADGSRATNTGAFQREQQRPTPPVMHQAGGHGGGGQWRHTYWVWPLPSPGSLTLVCEWPAMNIALTEYELDARLILDGAERAQVIFSDEHLPDPPDEDQGRPASMSSFVTARPEGDGPPPEAPARDSEKR
jgi:hypothetical protein